jgi:hypothetical protein
LLLFLAFFFAIREFPPYAMDSADAELPVVVFFVVVVRFFVDPVEFHGIGLNDFEFCLTVGTVYQSPPPYRQI